MSVEILLADFTIICAWMIHDEAIGNLGGTVSDILVKCQEHQ